MLPVPSDSLVGMYHPWIDANRQNYPNGIPFKNFLITDPIRQQIPWRSLSIASLKRGVFKAWNPYSFSGVPLATNIQAGFYYPFNIIFLLLPFTVSWTILIMSQTFLAGLFFYYFLRFSIKLSILASIFGAMNFMFSGFVIAWLTWGTVISTILWLPLLLLLIDTFIATKNGNKRVMLSILTGCILAVQYFAGHSQIFLYSTILYVFYAMFRFFVSQKEIKAKKTAIILFLVGPLISIIITSIHWIPFISQLGNVSRVQSSITNLNTEGFFLPLQHTIQFLVPDFFGNPATLNYWGIWNYAEFIGYIGVAGLLFAVYSLFARSKPQIYFWLGTIVLGLLFAGSNSISRIPYLVQLPILSSLQPTRLISVIDMSLCVLSAIGFDYWLVSNRKRSLIISLGIIISLLFALWCVVLFNPFTISQVNLMVAKRNLIFPSVLTGIFFCVFVARIIFDTYLKRHRVYIAYIAAIIIISIGFFDVVRGAWKFTPFTSPTLYYPNTSSISFLANQKRPYRIAVLDDRIMPSNVNNIYGIESIAGYDPLYDSRYEKFIAAMERGEPNIDPPYGFNRIITPKNISSPLFKLLGVKYVLSLSDITDPKFTDVFQEGETRIYEYSDVLPRAYLIEQVVYESDEKQIFQKMYAPEFHIGKTAIVETKLNLIDSPLTSSESVMVTSYRDDSIEVAIVSGQSRMLFIGNIYDPGWVAKLDGIQTPIYRANYLFMGVIIPPGKHTVLLKYE
jgi:hypothetical protein